MDQIVYQPEVLLQTTQYDLNRKDNIFSLSADQTKLLNALMPVGYTIVPRSKASNTLKKRDLTISFQQQRTNRINYQQYKDQQVFEPHDPITISPIAQLSSDMQKCMKILMRLKNHPQAGVFLDPVDTLVITDYLEYVSQPMDLGTIQQNILNGSYETLTQFLVDVKKVWFNAYSYNPKGTQIYLMTVQMDKFFDKILSQENIQIPSTYVSQPPPARQLLHVLPRPQPIKKKPQPSVVVSDIPLTMQQKRNLGSLIKKLPHEFLKGVWEIVSSVANDNNQELQFDIETLPARKARQLQQYVKKSFATIDAKNKQLTSFQARAKQNQASENEQSFIIDSDDSD